MINEPRVIVNCDKCGIETDPMEMCSLAGGGYDDRNIKPELSRYGWTFDGDKTYCDECSAPKEGR